MTDLKGELASLKIDRTRSGSSPWRWPLLLLLPVVAGLLVLYGLRARQAFSAVEVETTTVAVSRQVEASAGTPILTASGYVVARRKAIQRQMALNRIGDKVPKADVVVTNPTELAVAIQYDPLTMAAPIVLAKGAGVLAQRIRRLALENDIPVVERKPLAQLLYKDVAVNHPVPDQSYAAVAEVLAYVYQLKGKKMPTPRAA